MNVSCLSHDCLMTVTLLSHDRLMTKKKLFRFWWAMGQCHLVFFGGDVFFTFIPLQNPLQLLAILEGTACYAGFTSSSCEGPWPPAEAFYAVLDYFRPFLVFSKNLSNF